MISYVIAESRHFDLFEPKELFKTEMYHKKYLKEFADKRVGFAYTYFTDVNVLGCVGGHELWPGVAEVWAWLSCSITKHPIEFTKKILHCLNFHKERIGIHRYQMYVKADEKNAKRWAAILGFKEEGLMRKYGKNQEDFFMMGRV